MTSTIKVNTVTTESGSTLTLGGCGKTVALASGASQTGFGRTGTVDWQTGSIKTATFTAANGEGYFADTSGGAFNMNLPAGTAGSIVSVVDYTNTFQTNNLTIIPNGSQKIGGVAGDYIDKYIKYRQNRLPNEKAKLQKGLSQLAKQLTPAQKRLMKARLDQINDILDKQKAKQQPKPLTPKDFAKYDRRVRVKAPTRQS